MFDENWTLQQIKDYVANPHDEKYTNLEFYKFVELAACAAHYVTDFPDDQKDSVQVSELKRLVALDVVDMLQKSLDEGLYDSYIDFYLTGIAERLAEPQRSYCYGNRYGKTI